MELLAAIGIEPLIIIGVMIASAILQAIAKRKSDQENWENSTSQPAPPQVAPPRPPRRVIIPSSPSSLPKLPPKIPPALDLEREIPARALTRFEQTQVNFERASNLQQRIHDRMAETDRQTQKHVPTGPPSRNRSKSADLLLKSFRKPESIRQAFLASFVLNPPKALE